MTQSFKLKSIIENDIWKIVKRFESAEVIGSMILRNKYKPDGTIERRKARLVARGFAQRPGIDYHDMFAPVVLSSTIGLLIALAIWYGIRIH